MKTKRESLWRLRTYDLWSDGDGGYSVNDVYDQGLVTLTMHLKTYNQGTPHKFKSWDITDRYLTNNYYGSCSGCDSLRQATEGIYIEEDERDRDRLNQAAEDCYTLALHMFQRMTVYDAAA